LDVASDLNNPLPFRDATFETILLSSVLEHIAEPQQLWHELERIASPGGMVLLNVPFLYWVHEEPHDYYRYTEFALRRLAENAGFGIRLITPIGGALHVIADSCAKVLGSHGGRLGRGAPPVVQGLTAAISRTKFGKKFTAGTALNFPLGYFMVAEKPPAST
jgi:SAM-dependent methyltransferase